MLTQTDLKAIEKIIEPLKIDVGTLKSDVGSLKTDVGVLKTDVGTLKSDAKSLKDGQLRLEKSQKQLARAIKHEHQLLDEVLVTLDGDIVKVSRRVDRIEGHLHLSPS